MDKQFLKDCFPSLNSDDERVKLDPFHALDRYPLPQKSPITPVFMAFMRDAMFVNCDEDMSNARSLTMLRNPDLDARFIHSKIFRHRGRARRLIPEVCYLR
jgi:hypothetical protein